jgi:hypothetical protein
MTDLNPADAQAVLESLRKGIPPRRFARLYSVGHEQLLAAIHRRHLQSPSSAGRIRFVSGSWGAGKTHFLRLLREEAFDAQYLVSVVELTADQTPFNRFERVLYEIVRNISSPEIYRLGQLQSALPFGDVLQRASFHPEGSLDGQDAYARIDKAKQRLFAASEIDIDFRRIIAAYWDTFAADDDPAQLEDLRGRLLQWFEGEGTVAGFRRDFNVQKMVSKTNARQILQSMGLFARFLGYRGLTVLLDESEMSHSTMRKSSLRQAHNNLLNLLNEIEQSEGIFLVLAAVPEFFNDPVYGVQTFGALAQRIGRLEERAPLALDRVWNLDAIATPLSEYEQAAAKIRALYLIAEAEPPSDFISEEELRRKVADLVTQHGAYSHISRWRLVITGTVRILDDSLEGITPPPTTELYEGLMGALRDG